MSMLDNQLAHRTAGGIELRFEPLRVRWHLDDLITADQNTLRVRFSCSVRAIDDPTQRRMLQEVLLGPRQTLNDQDVSAHFAPSLRTRAAEAAKLKGAEAWLAGDGREALKTELKKAAETVAFACGVEVLPPYELELDSPTFEQQRLRAMQRALAEQEAAGKVQHAERAMQLLRQFEEIRKAAPGLAAGRVIEQLSPADRGSTLQTLLLAAAAQEEAQQLWAVAGPYLVRIDTPCDEGAQHTTPRTALSPLPPSLGPLRSVQPAMIDGQRFLLIGAQTGVMLVRPDDVNEPQLFACPSLQSPLGFSRVIFQESTRELVACHGEAGIVRWSLANDSAPVSILPPERFRAAGSDVTTAQSGSQAARSAGPRNLQPLDDCRLIFSVGGKLWLIEQNSAMELAAPAGADVIAIVPDESRLYVISEDSAVSIVDRRTRQVITHPRRAGRLCSAGGLPFLGSSRLLLATDDGTIQCAGTDDPLITQYASPHHGLRVVTGSTALVAGVSADRQRLVLWNSWDGSRPSCEVYLTSLTRRRIADIEFA
jgi:hypothetical protein